MADTETKSLKSCLFLLVIAELGTLDHAVALASQVVTAGGDFKFVVAGEFEIPQRAKHDLPDSKSLTDEEALLNLPDFAAVWFSTPYVNLLPLAWQRAWERKDSVYSGYGISLTDWSFGRYDLDIYNHCFIMASSPSEVAHFTSDEKSVRQVEWTGDPLLFELASNSPSICEAGTERVFLWAPHWTERWVDGSRGFATWQWAVSELERFFTRNPNLRLIFRPHPLTEFDKGKSKSRLQLSKLIGLNNVTISEASMREDIERSDVLISDGVAILAYFGVTGKPILSLLNKENCHFDSHGEAILATTYRSTRPREFRKSLQRFTLRDKLLYQPSSKTRATVLQRFPLREVSPGELLVKRFQSN